MSSYINNRLVINPLLIPEILNQVLGYIDSTKSLLNCRIVSHSWNHVATKLLNEKGCTFGLDFNDLKKYAVLSSSNPGLTRLNVNLRIRLPPRYDAKEKEHINSINKVLLTNNTVQVCGLTIKAPPMPSKSDFIELALRKILEYVAPSLRFLILSGEVTLSDIESNHPEPTYPNLALIHGSEGPCLSEPSRWLTSIISHSPKLLKLGLISSSGVSEGFARIVSNLKQMTRHSFDLGLEKLELSIDSMDVYNDLCGLKLSTLKRLVLHDNISQYLSLHNTFRVRNDVDNLFEKFINSKCPNLSCLELYSSYDYHGLIDHILRCSLPIAAQIETFGYYLKLYNNGYNNNTTMSNSGLLQCLRKFPLITTLKLNVEALLSVTKFYRVLFADSLTPLSSVTTVKVYINLLDIETETNFENSTTGTINILLELLFPNVVNLTLKQQLKGKTTTDSNYVYLKLMTEIPHPLYNLLVAIITAWNGLRRLKIKGYVDDWLNTIMAMEQKRQGEGNLIGLLRNLELLCIQGLKRNHHNFDEYNVTQKLLSVTPRFYGRPPSFDLVQFVKVIPTIATLQIDEELLPRPLGLREQIRVTARKWTNNVQILALVLFILITIYSLGFLFFMRIEHLNQMRRRKNGMH